VLAVLRGEEKAPKDLRERALLLAGSLIEFSSNLPDGTGRGLAQAMLDDGSAWKKFQAICEAQGRMREPPHAKYTQEIIAHTNGRVTSIDNRRLARVAKLAGAPKSPAAGLKMHTSLDRVVEQREPLFTVHAETPGEMAYATSYLQANSDIFVIEETV
jgi:thymidine phosphorylase